MAGHKTTRKGGSQAMPNNSNNKNKKTSNAPSSTFSSKKKTRKSMESKLHSVYKDEEIEEKGNFDQFENYEYEPPSDFEDEEIDEDGAFNSEDEEQFQGLEKFIDNQKGSKKKVNGKGKSKIEDDEEEEEEEDELEEDFNDDDEDSDNYIDISELLPSGPKQSYELDDFKDSQFSDEGEDEEVDDEDDRLENIVGTINQLGKKNQKRKAAQLREANEESEFGLTPREEKGKTLSLSDMIDSLKDNRVKKKLKTLGQSSSLSTPVPQIIQDRINRKAAYEETSKDISKWTHFVQRMRKADHLMFPMDAPKKENPTTLTLTKQHKDETDLEKNIANILETSGINENELKSKEDLAFNEVTVEEVLQRRKELQKMRSLMFHHEIKSKRTKKIKSKKYHKILKKERERNQMSIEDLEDLDPEAAKEKKLELLAARARERMTQRHKIGGKWAKGVSRKNASVETRAAIDQKLRLAAELKKKIEGIESSDEDDDYNSQDENSNDSDDDFKEKETPELPQKGLFALKFMQKAMEKDKAIKVSDNESDSEPEEQSGRRVFHSKVDGSEKETFSTKLMKGKTQVDKVSFSASHKTKISAPVTVNFESNNQDLNVNSEDVQSDSDENDLGMNQEKIELDGEKNQDKKIKKGKEVAQKTKKNEKGKKEESEKEAENKKGLTKGNKTKNLVQQKEEKEDEVEDENKNVWFEDQGTKRTTKEKGSKSKKKQVDADSILDHEIEVNEKEKTSKKDNKNKSTQKSQSAPEKLTEDTNIAENPEFEVTREGFAIRQIDLIRRAFANDDVLEKDFESEKNELVDQETEKDEDLTLPGWGSWGGEGTKPQQHRIIKKAKPQKDRKDKNLKNVIINEKIDKKSLKYTVEQAPFPFESKEQYSRTLLNPVGKEWNTMSSYQKLIKPRVIVKQGSIIEPPKFVKQAKKANPNVIN